MLTYEEAEDLVDSLPGVYNDWMDMYHRADHVNWSPENEQKAFQEWCSLRKKILDNMKIVED